MNIPECTAAAVSSQRNVQNENNSSVTFRMLKAKKINTIRWEFSAFKNVFLLLRFYFCFLPLSNANVGTLQHTEFVWICIAEIDVCTVCSGSRM